MKMKSIRDISFGYMMQRYKIYPEIWYQIVPIFSKTVKFREYSNQMKISSNIWYTKITYKIEFHWIYLMNSGLLSIVSKSYSECWRYSDRYNGHSRYSPSGKAHGRNGWQGIWRYIFMEPCCTSEVSISLYLIGYQLYKFFKTVHVTNVQQKSEKLFPPYLTLL